MGNALSMALRVRFRNLMDRGLSPATAARWGKQVRDGDLLEPLPSVPRKGSGKPESFVSFFVELIEQDPDITLVELRAALLATHDMRCSTSGIDALLRRHGYTYKRRGLYRKVTFIFDKSLPTGYRRVTFRSVKDHESSG